MENRKSRIALSATVVGSMATDDAQVPEGALELKDLVHLLHHRTAQWRAMGLQLGVPMHVLDTIQSNHAGRPDMTQSCLIATLSWCLRKGRVFTQKDVTELCMTRGKTLRKRSELLSFHKRLCQCSLLHRGIRFTTDSMDVVEAYTLYVGKYLLFYCP